MTKEIKQVVTTRTNLPRDISDLLAMLTYKRPSGGKTEYQFIRRFIEPLGAVSDTYGNYWHKVGDAPILWSCHTDTVHQTEGIQRILYGDGLASVDKGECLGADCGTGVWLMREMILAGVAGTYVFHCEEEVGGFGSDYIATETAEKLNGIQFAIAFDRKGTSEIITHQMSKRCASELFAVSLAECLRPLEYKSSNGGTFTDTANYARIIPECTNLSVGYYKQHTKGEHQDVYHALKLRDALCTADFSRLVVDRDPSVPVLAWKADGAKSWSESDLDSWFDERADYNDLTDDTGLTGFVRRNADDVAAFLEALGYSQEDLEDFIHFGDK